ncbi:hypothetical protein AAFF_G00163020 [Aldrovandia affinis]|uniref:Inactive serine protease 35 n=1 Tax=Aldrovandia affinis TaxID=143900 RepID=A0AAD7WX41_9TELE|nr:hypothetical protein AAFF_G00163020 [Aldrovandia affinis]
MDPVPLCLLLSLAVLGVAAGVAAAEEDDEYTWPRGRVPLVRDRRTVRLSSPGFTAEPGQRREPRGTCGIECQSRLPRPSAADLENLLSYETVYENGTRTLTEVSLQDAEEGPAGGAENASTRPLSRRRREVYGTDSRFTIADKHFATNYPFSTTVKVSTGCSGILVSPRHVLTAAHCIHDGQDYVKGVKRLRVGLLKLRSKRRKGSKGGGGEGGGRKGRRKGEGKEEGGEEEEEGGKEEGEGKGERRGRRGRKSRSRRSTESKQPSFRWTRVKQTQVPKGWFRGVADAVAVDYDYAVLELKRPHRQRHMDLGVVPSVRKLPAGRIHFSGFDDDRPSQLVYRFCSVSEESGDLLYQYCDAQPGSSGSGIYVRLKEPGKRKWKRKIIGVFSGHHWVDVNGAQQDYNVAVRITPAKFAQICYWLHGDSNECRDV